MSYIFEKNILSESKFKLKSPYSMDPIGICVHNTYNDASADNEVSYHNNNNNATSYHIAVDDKKVIQCLPFNRNAFHAGDGGNGSGNRKYIGIEICYSKSGGQRYKEAEENAVQYIAKLLKQYGWTIKNVKKHQDFSGKYCPHRILDEKRWNSFLNRIEAAMKPSTPSSPVDGDIEKRAKSLIQKAVDKKVFNKDAHKELNKYTNDQLLRYLTILGERLL